MAESQDAGKLDLDTNPTDGIEVYLQPEPNAPLTFRGQFEVPNTPPPIGPPYPLTLDIHLDAPVGCKEGKCYVQASGYTIPEPEWTSLGSQLKDCPLVAYATTEVSPSWPVDVPITVTVIYYPDTIPR